jgi:hypothetical protein
LKFLHRPLGPLLVVAGRDDRVGRDRVDADFGKPLHVLEKLPQAWVIEQLASRFLDGLLHRFPLLRRGRRTMPSNSFTLDGIGIDGVEQPVGQRLGVETTRLLDDAGARRCIDLAVECGKPASERRERIVVVAARRHIVEQPVEGDRVLALEWLRHLLQRFSDADSIDEDEAGFFLRVGRHLPQRRGIYRTRATSLHLLEVELRLHVAQKDQGFQRLHVGAGCDHVDGDDDARIVIIAELAEELLGVGIVDLVGDLLGEIIPFAEHFAHDPTISSAW